MSPDESQRDEFYAPMPATAEPVDADAELDLQDQAADTQELVYAEPDPRPLGRAPAYDFARRLFVPSSAGGPLMVDGRATLALWCEKAVNTVQGENPAVDSSFGLRVSLTELLADGHPPDPGAIAEAVDIITEALKVHPLVTDVLDVTIDADDPDDDAVFLSYTVMPEGEDEEPLVVDALPVLLGGAEDG